MTPTVVISRRGAERVRMLHPWVFRSDVLEAEATPGDLVQVKSERGRTLGWAFWSSESQIAIRMVSLSTSPPAGNEALIAERVRAALSLRQALRIDSTAWRLVHAESDGLPSMIVDRYGDETGVYLVVQTLSQGADRRLPALVAVLVDVLAPRGVLARNDPRVRQLEGLEQQVDVVFGEIPDRVHVVEGGVRYACDLRGGQKTGLFLDQRENHSAAAGYARGDALDAFTYNGGFALQMARRASKVVAIDSSETAIAATAENARANGLTNVELRAANVFDELRELEIAGARFDTVVLDPPAFAKNKAAVDRAIAGYKEINLRALRLLRPGGHLITCSCSYNVDESLFLSVIQDAVADARVQMTLVERRLQARDHPILITMPETSYLKCLVLRRNA